MATSRTPERKNPDVKEFTFAWEGKDRKGKIVRGEIRAASETAAVVMLRRQGILPVRVKKQKLRGGHGRVKEKDIALFTRQMATMMKSGVPLLQSFDIVAKGHANPAVSRLLLDIKTDVETGSSLEAAFRKFPRYFDDLFCSLIGAGEAAGILDSVLDRLATYKEKTLAIKSKIKSAMFYPVSIIVVAVVITAVIMIFVVPAFKNLFASFGANLPAPTLIIMAISDFFVNWWWAIFGGLFGGVYLFFRTLKNSKELQDAIDRLLLQLPVFGPLLKVAAVARWSRTLSTMFAAGVPLVEAFDSVAGSAGNIVYYQATKKVQREVAGGSALASAMQDAGVFPSMVIQMTSIGEETGALDSMLGKVADFYEAEVDDAVEALSSLMEPIIMVVLGGLIGSMVIAMYLPIFKMGEVVSG
jgi:type IV pilus assembly protein PilC